MSGEGGFGAMYRQAGFEPSPAVCRDGFLTLIAGKIYMDAPRAPEMFFENFPFKYDIERASEAIRMRRRIRRRSPAGRSRRG